MKTTRIPSKNTKTANTTSSVSRPGVDCEACVSRRQIREGNVDVEMSTPDLGGVRERGEEENERVPRVYPLPNRQSRLSIIRHLFFCSFRQHRRRAGEERGETRKRTREEKQRKNISRVALRYRLSTYRTASRSLQGQRLHKDLDVRRHYSSLLIVLLLTTSSPNYSHLCTFLLSSSYLSRNV